MTHISKFRKFSTFMFTVDLTDIDKEDGLFLELINRQMQGEELTLPRSFFYRSCKRNGLSTHEMLNLMMKESLLEGHDFPYKLKPFDTQICSASKWYSLGFKVRGEARSYARNIRTGLSLFNKYQVRAI